MARRIAVGIAFIVLSLIVVFLVINKQNQIIFSGSRVKNPDRYYLEFSYMNQTDFSLMELQKGDVLSVSFAITKGHVNIGIGMEGNKPVYKGDDIESGNFTVEIEKTGQYRIDVSAKRAAGVIDIILKEKGS